MPPRPACSGRMREFCGRNFPARRCGPAITPQSQAFLDECDRLGLLVFTELPGWQHIGDEAWKDRACAMLEEMILQNRNHPSIILWGVRINESQDDDAFYARTNAIAHKLDPSRQTSGSGTSPRAIFWRTCTPSTTFPTTA